MTVRAHIYIVNRSLWVTATVIIFSVFSTGCAKTPEVVSPREKQVQSSRVVALDVARRGKSDTWRHVQPGEKPGEEVLLKEEVDLNGDGKVDLTKSFQNGELSRVDVDLDFDGKPDLTEFFEKGVVVKTEMTTQFTGKTDTWRYYENGQLVRVEQDTHGDGKADRWVYYKGGKVDRTGVDLNSDGIVDTWE